MRVRRMTVITPYNVIFDELFCQERKSVSVVSFFIIKVAEHITNELKGTVLRDFKNVDEN